jgi:hypothetical protein
MTTPPPITANEGEVPPRVTLYQRPDPPFGLGGMAFADPYTPVEKMREYLSHQEHSQILSAEKQRGLRAAEEARAQAFEEAALWFHKTRVGTQTFPDWCREKARQARAAKEPS